MGRSKPKKASPVALPALRAGTQSGMTIRIAKEELRVRPRLGVQVPRVEKVKTKYSRKSKHPKR